MKLSFSFLVVIGLIVLFTCFGIKLVANHEKSRSSTVFGPQRVATSSAPTVATVPAYLSPPQKATSVAEVHGPSIIKIGSDDSVSCVVGEKCRQPLIITLKDTSEDTKRDKPTDKETPVKPDKIKVVKLCCRRRIGKKSEYKSYILYAIHKLTQNDELTISIFPAIVIAVVSFLLALFQELYIDYYRSIVAKRVRAKSPQVNINRSRARGIKLPPQASFKRTRG